MVNVCYNQIQKEKKKIQIQCGKCSEKINDLPYQPKVHDQMVDHAPYIEI